MKPVTQMTVCEKSELRLARCRPAVSSIPTAEVTVPLFISARAENKGFRIEFANIHSLHKDKRVLSNILHYEVCDL